MYYWRQFSEGQSPLLKILGGLQPPAPLVPTQVVTLAMFLGCLRSINMTMFNEVTESIFLKVHWGAALVKSLPLFRRPWWIGHIPGISTITMPPRISSKVALSLGHSQILSYSCGENREKVWDHCYVTDRKWWTRLVCNVDSVCSNRFHHFWPAVR